MISRRAETPLFFLLRTQGLWKHTLCAAAGRSKDLGAPCGVSRQGTAMLSWEWVSGLFQTHAKITGTFVPVIVIIHWTPPSVYGVWETGTLPTLHTIHHRGGIPHRSTDASYVPQQRFLSLQCVLSWATLPRCIRMRSYTHTHTHPHIPTHTHTHTHTHQTLTHTHSLLSAHEAIKHTHP